VSSQPARLTFHPVSWAASGAEANGVPRPRFTEEAVWEGLQRSLEEILRASPGLLGVLVTDGTVLKLPLPCGDRGETQEVGGALFCMIAAGTQWFVMQLFVTAHFEPEAGSSYLSGSPVVSSVSVAGCDVRFGSLQPVSTDLTPSWFSLGEDRLPLNGQRCPASTPPAPPLVAGRDRQLRDAWLHLAPLVVGEHARHRVRCRLRRPRGLLVYGEACSGKSSLCRTLAWKLGRSSPPVVTEWVDCGSLRARKMVAVLEELTAAFDRAAKVAPTLLVLDDLDLLAPVESEDGGEANAQACEIADHLRHLLSELDDMDTLADARLANLQGSVRSLRWVHIQCF
jgi:hypothetical protein